MRTSPMIVTLVAAGTLALGAGVALAAPTNTAAEGSKTPAVAATTPVAKTPAVKTKAKESPATQKAEQAREQKGEMRRSAEGVVTHVEPQAVPPTLVMKTQEGKQELIVGVDVPATTIIREGKSVKSLQDLKPGDRLWMRWTRAENRLVADAIHVLPAHSAAASKTATAIAKTGTAKQAE